MEVRNNVFFRGHSDSEYLLEPGIYRKDKKKERNLVQYEDRIYREIISTAPQDFIGKNTLETLALMQHYDAPTRILDLTENALVALYFACAGNDDKDGEIIAFDIPDHGVCHYDSDRVTILCNLAKCDKTFSFTSEHLFMYGDKIKELEAARIPFTFYEELEDEPRMDMLEHFMNDKELIEKYEDSVDNLESLYSSSLENYKKSKGKLSATDEKYFRDYLITSIQAYYRREYNEELKRCNQDYLGKLLHNIREDKAYFDGIINPADISSVFAVRPKLDNPRITKQHGAFLIFGIQQNPFAEIGNIKPMAKLTDSWLIRGEKNGERILIDRKCKPKIIKELNSLGLNQSTLFPEVDKVSSFVKAKYIDRL